MIKVVAVLFAAMAAAVLGAKLLYEATARSEIAPAEQPWAQNRMEFVAWNGSRWTAWIRDDKFELQPQTPGKWQRHANATLAFIDWEGEPWQAKIERDEFLLAHRGNWRGQTERARALRYRNWQGEQQLRTVTQLRR